jgi:hypothetical protein
LLILGGWINAMVRNSSYIDDLTLLVIGISQQRSWSLVGKHSSVNASLVGMKPYKPPFTFEEILEMKDVSSFSSDPNATGLLGSFTNRFYSEYEPTTVIGIRSIQPIPWYDQSSSNSHDNSDFLDDEIVTALDIATAEIAKLDKTALEAVPFNFAKVNSLNIKINDILKTVPHGAIYFNQIDHFNKSYKYMLQYGSDPRLSGIFSLVLIYRRYSVSITGT